MPNVKTAALKIFYKGAIASKIKHAVKLKTSPATCKTCTTVAALISILF